VLGYRSQGDPRKRKGDLVSERLLIVGWDGADWDIIDDLIARGNLPHVADMLQAGARGTLVSTIPINSWAAWPTFLTGMSPAGHGVFDFIERRPSKRGKRLPVFSTSIRARTFLEWLSEAGHEVRAGNIPVTFPPFPVNGRLISGGAIPPGAAFIYPSEWGEELADRAPFPINGMEWTRFKTDPEALIEEARRFVQQRTQSFEVLLEGDWSVAVCVFVATDRLQHPLGDHLIPSHPDYARRVDTQIAEDLRGFYQLLDKSLGRLREVAGPSATTLLVSDHGFEPVDRAYNLNAVLARQGFATPGLATGATSSLYRSFLWRKLSHTRMGQLIRRTVRTPSSMNWRKTLAYQSASGEGVSVNLKGREPEGVVERKDFERVREEVREGLLAFEDRDLGKPIGAVLRSEEFFTGAHANLAPDLLALPNPLWVPDHTDQAAARLDWPTADHRRAGILIAVGSRVTPGGLGERQLRDIAPTVLAACGVPFSGMEGHVIEEIAGGDAVSDGRGEPPGTRHPEPEEISAEDAEKITEHLRSLGYVE
jgi:predicted AlkP superfamily phosphohydrolase/phosphomutase